jgi:anti-sigma factor RsiW
MKTSDFESRFTAWLDGQLPAQEVAEFEREMRERGFDPASEQEAFSGARTLLREHSFVPNLPHPDYFQHRLLHQIELDQKEPRVPSTSWWRFPRLIWAGAVSLLVAGVLFKAMIPYGAPPQESPPYFATVVDVRTYEPTISVDTIYNPEDNVTVLWLNGLDYLAGDIFAQ